jgi:cytochrome c-type biogenesis protein
MSEFDLFQLVALPVGLGLLGFVEPCSIGSSMILVKVIEDQSAATRIAQVGVFALTRALLIGALGALAALIGTVFLDLQKGAWLLLGLLYIAVGAFYAFGKAGFLMRSFGPSLSQLAGLRGSIGLGLLFGLNIPACAAPLIFALLGAAALGSSGSGAVVLGFVSLGLFGLALSAPLVLAVLWQRGRRLLDWLAGLSIRVPLVIGLVLIGLGLWSVYFGLFVDLADWT